MEREVGGGIGMGNTCKPMAVSFQCMTKSTTNKKKKKKWSRDSSRGGRKIRTLDVLGPEGRARVQTAKTVSRGRVPLDWWEWGEKIRFCLKVSGSLNGAPCWAQVQLQVVTGRQWGGWGERA